MRPGFALVALLFQAMIGCVKLERFEYRQLAMGTEARIVLYTDNEDHARQAARAAFDRITHLDAVMSDWRVDSELMRLCQRAGETVPVSDDLFRVLSRAGEITDATDGAFDVTIGPVVRLWREARHVQRLPDPNRLAAARELVGWEKVKLDSSTRSVRLEQSGMQLDLGGIGKGFAADEARRELAMRGVEQCLVDLGGDIATGEAPPAKRGWSVAVEPGRGAGAGGETILLRHRAVATSGDAFQFVEVDGLRYSHIVDPRTGIGLTNRFGVTVEAPDATTADALASAFSVLGAERSAEIVAKFPDVQVTRRAVDDPPRPHRHRDRDAEIEE